VPFLEYSGPQRVTLGAARVVTQGTVLTAVGVWDQGVTATYHWVVGGQETTVTGGPTYATTASDAGHLVIVNVWLEKLGYRKMMVSDAVTVVNAKLASVAPKIVGTPRVGKKLSVRTAWPSGTTLDYQWYRYSRKIPGATGATYRLRKTDRGKWLQVMVTASRPGYDTMTRFSGPSKRVRR
jgi:hypothetical protein